jgi:hypothetical protein
MTISCTNGGMAPSSWPGGLTSLPSAYRPYRPQPLACHNMVTSLAIITPLAPYGYVLKHTVLQSRLALIDELGETPRSDWRGRYGKGAWMLPTGRRCRRPPRPDASLLARMLSIGDAEGDPACRAYLSQVRRRGKSRLSRPSLPLRKPLLKGNDDGCRQGYVPCAYPFLHRPGERRTGRPVRAILVARAKQISESATNVVARRPHP